MGGAEAHEDAALLGVRDGDLHCRDTQGKVQEAARQYPPALDGGSRSGGTIVGGISVHADTLAGGAEARTKAHTT